MILQLGQQLQTQLVIKFSPDWVWIKSTDSGNGSYLFDTIRGANKRLTSASGAAEATVTDELMSF